MSSHYQICVSGAAKGHSVEEGKDLALKLGAAIAKSGHSLMTGATVGLPNYAAEGYKAAGGMHSIGLSPAATKVEHVLKYRLPVEAYDAIVFTGLHYVGRDALLINSSDAVVSLGGRLGTLHEFTIAMETETPIGFLQGAGGISEEIQTIMTLAHPLPSGSHAVFSEDANDLLQQLVAILDEEYKKYSSIYN